LHDDGPEIINLAPTSEPIDGGAQKYGFSCKTVSQTCISSGVDISAWVLCSRKDAFWLFSSTTNQYYKCFMLASAICEEAHALSVSTHC
jgi:hypothetical protein